MFYFSYIISSFLQGKSNLIKTKYFLSEKKTPSPMSAIFENCGYKLLELLDILTNFPFSTTETKHDY